MTCLMRCDELLGMCMSVLCDDGVDQSLLVEIARHQDSQGRLKGTVLGGSGSGRG